MAVASRGGKLCTRDTLRCSDARKYQDELKSCCRGHIIELSQCVADLLNKAGIPFWADYGTLLGAVRNPLTTWADYPWLPQDDRPPGPLAPGIIPHDKDADWGLLYQNFRGVARILQAAAREHRYDLIVRPVRGSMKLRLSKLNHTNLDLFFWRRRDGGAENYYRLAYIGVDDFKGREFTPDMLFPLTTVEWEGLTLPAPRDPAAFCEFRYGPNWRTPVCANHDGVRR